MVPLLRKQVMFILFLIFAHTRHFDDPRCEFSHLEEDVREETPEEASNNAKVRTGDRTIDNGQRYLQIVLGHHKLAL